MAERATIVPESAVRLEVNGRLAAVWTCTPLQLDALAAGRLIADGYVQSHDEILGLEIDADRDDAFALRARVAPAAEARGLEEAEHRRDAGCGLLHGLRCDPNSLRPAAARATPPDPDAFVDLYRELFAQADREGFSSGIHSAALSDGASLLFQAQEVGRHNAVDKAIGGALLAGEDPARLGLVLSARISGEIAFKAARAGLAWVASRSIPTSLAVRIAGAARLPLIARAPGKAPRVFGAAPGPEGDPAS